MGILYTFVSYKILLLSQWSHVSWTPTIARWTWNVVAQSFRLILFLQIKSFEPIISRLV